MIYKTKYTTVSSFSENREWFRDSPSCLVNGIHFLLDMIYSRLLKLPSGRVWLDGRVDMPFVEMDADVPRELLENEGVVLSLAQYMYVTVT
jgi:hypothetical protein